MSEAAHAVLSAYFNDPFADPIYIDPFLLSTGSLFIIIGQLWLILGKSAETKAH